MFAFEMERAMMAVVVVMGMMDPVVRAQDNRTTLDGLFHERLNSNIPEISLNVLKSYGIAVDDGENDGHSSVKPTPLQKFTKELVDYTQTLVIRIALEFSWDLEVITVESVCKDLNSHCSKDLVTPIRDLREKLTSADCVKTRLLETMRAKMKQAIKVARSNVSLNCARNSLFFCSPAVADRSCITRYAARVEQLLTSYVHDANDALLRRLRDRSPFKILQTLLFSNVRLLTDAYQSAKVLYWFAWLSTFSAPATEPFGLDNLLHPWTNHGVIEFSARRAKNNTKSRDGQTWGVIGSKTGTVDRPCSSSVAANTNDSEERDIIRWQCYVAKMLQSSSKFIRCARGGGDPTTRALTWSTVSSLYVHSQCLCLASNGDDCSVTAPRGVDLSSYCLSVLLGDFRRQVSYRPAVTYLDYAFQIPVPACKFSYFLSSTFRNICPTSINKHLTLELIQSVQCYFKDIVNMDLNCSEAVPMTTYDLTALCGMKYFMLFVLCGDGDDGDDGDGEIGVPYYEAGDSTLVQVLTYGDVAVRLLTLVPFVVCPQLRNLPGKLLIGYQLTALLRLVVVRASLLGGDMALAVHLDVPMDLSSTLWLTSYLHFLTVSIRDLRLPDSLSPREARLVLLSYSLLSSALPAALSPWFFWMDELVVVSHLLLGQLLFVLCSFVALFANVFMIVHNCRVYYDVRSEARVRARVVFADLFNFAVKTSLLSGAGISVRLVFTQIHGLESLLGYCHALGTLQGLLFFLLYGCNRRARAFWLSVLRATLRHCRRLHHRPASYHLLVG